MKKDRGKFFFASLKEIIFLSCLGFGIFINANDRIEKLILRIDIDKIRLLFDSDVLLRAEDKERYINLGLKNKQNLKEDIEKKKLNKQDLIKVAYGLVGLYGFSKSLVWLSFFKEKNTSEVNLSEIDASEEYDLKITTVFKYLSYAASSLLFYFSSKQLYEGLTKKFRVVQYKKAIAILAILDRMVVRKDIDRSNIK